MLTNATITRIDTGSAGPAGNVTFTTGSTIAQRIGFEPVSRSQLWALGELVSEAEWCAYVPTTLSVSVGQRLVVTVDGDSAANWRVVYARRRQKAGGLEHLEVYVRRIA